jgi:hypothetical protein
MVSGFDSRCGLMQDADLQHIYKAWAAERLGVKEENIREVTFETIYGGYCETCAYETFGAIVHMKRGQDREIEDWAGDLMSELLSFALAQKNPA